MAVRACAEAGAGQHSFFATKTKWRDTQQGRKGPVKRSISCTAQSYDTTIKEYSTILLLLYLKWRLSAAQQASNGLKKKSSPDNDEPQRDKGRESRCVEKQKKRDTVVFPSIDLQYTAVAARL